MSRSYLDSFSRFFNGLNPKAKVALCSVFATAVVGVGYALWPDRESVLQDWDENYESLCHGPAPESELKSFGDARSRVTSTFDDLSRTGYVGRRAISKSINRDDVFCYGNRHEDDPDKPISYFRLTDIYFIDQELKDPQVSYYLYSSELEDFADDAADRSNRYITSAGILWARTREAARITAHIAGIYQLFQNGFDNERLFSSPEWKDLQASKTYGPSLQAFEMAIMNDPYDMMEASRQAYFEALQNKTAMNEADLTFLSWYIGQVDQDSYDQCTSYNDDGSCAMSITIYEDPPSYVHSRNIAPETLVELSAVFSNGEPYLSKQDAKVYIEDPQSVILHSDRARSYYETAVRRAKSYCRGNYSGESEPGLGLNISIGQVK